MSPRGRVLAATGTALVLAVLMLLLFLILKLGRASDQIGALNTADQSRDRAIAALADAEASARAQIKALGGTPNVPPPQVIISSIPGAVGQQGPGPSDAQVAAAVAAYLVAHPVPGVSTEQITAAVTAYLVASPPPSGPAGPGPSDQQVASAVAAYMSANPAPSGPAGPAGRDGQNGVNGSPPAGWSFEANGVTYNCVPDNGTPAPHYTCPPEPSASASPTSPPTPSNSASPAAGTPTPAPTVSSATTVASTPTSFATLIEGPVHEAGDAGRRAFVLLGVPLYRRGL